MIISALCEYYDVLANDEKAKISPYGYEKTLFHYTAVLSENGELRDVIAHIADKKKDKPQSSIMPVTMKSSAVGSSPVCDNMSYVFGVDDGKGKGKLKFKAAQKLHLELFENAVSKEAVAMRAFFQTWNPEEAAECECVAKHLIKGASPHGNVAFRLQGETSYFHECDEIRQIWLDENAKKAAASGEYTAQCAVTGENAAIAKLHAQLSGVKGAQATGASLICFNKPADESYNLPQSHNSHVSEVAMFKYTTALQWLLRSAENKLYIGDDTCVFWASAQNHSDYENSVIGLFSGISEDDSEDKNEVDRVAEEQIRAIMSQGAKGVPSVPNFDPETSFYVLGLAPNAGRVSVRYFYRNSFAEFCDKIKQYYDETQICGNFKHTKIGSLLFATISANSAVKKVNPLLGGAVMRALLSGGKYPELFFNQVILRVKAEKQVSQPRAAAIKAYLVRNKKEEVLPMLNEQSTKPAYVLGRIFAILEMIQKNSVDGKLNATIKDKYFSTACSTPALAFPTLLKLAQHHLAKFESLYWEKKLGECLALIETFPKAQNMENQGQFILGYYHQTQKNYEKKEKNENGSN